MAEIKKLKIIITERFILFFLYIKDEVYLTFLERGLRTFLARINVSGSKV